MNNLIKILSIIVFFYILYSSVLLAAPLNPIYYRVKTFSMQYLPNEPFNTQEEYNGHIIYEIKQDIITVEFNGQTIKVNFKDLVNEAANTWNLALGEGGSSFSLIEYTGQKYFTPNFTVTTEIPKYIKNPIFFGYASLPSKTARKSNPGIYININRYNQVYGPYNSPIVVKIKPYFKNGTDNSQLINIIMYRTLLHEFGHALGLAHTYERSHLNDKVFWSNNLTKVKDNFVFKFAKKPITIPIMMPFSAEYWEQLNIFFDKKIEFSDIKPSNIETNALKYLTMCITNNKRVKKDILNTSDCNNIKKYKSINFTYNILLNDKNKIIHDET